MSEERREKSGREKTGREKIRREKRGNGKRGNWKRETSYIIHHTSYLIPQTYPASLMATKCKNHLILFYFCIHLIQYEEKFINPTFKSF